MVSFNQFLKTVLLAVVYASATGATPFPTNVKHATHRVREVGQGLKIETYHPVSTFETFGVGIDHPLSKRDNPDLEESAVAFIQSQLRVAKDAIAFTSGFSGEVAKHAFLKQSHDGIPFANAVANVAFNHNNKVVSFGSSFVKPTKIASSTPSISLEDAIAKAEVAIDGTYNGHPPALEYLVMQDGSVALTHVIQIQNEEKGTWVEAFIDAHTGELRSITDFVNKASYRVVPITSEVPVVATGVMGFETLTDPQDTVASPLGWHNDGTTTTTTTAGNNAIAFKGSQSSLTSQSSAPLNFVYPADLTLAPTSVGNVNAARVNAFYLVNSKKPDLFPFLRVTV
ncbi:hypothetical protein ONZ45_g14134 [Pleurotus djamor]|nr:hypothetical protein ONZ45_g14134 [Pleurotus djamor]